MCGGHVSWACGLAMWAGGGGWPWGVVSVQPGAGATPEASIPAVFVVGMARFRMHPKISRSDAILGRSVGPWRYSMRANAFPIAALHSGMRVVCVWVREKITTAPPSPPSPRAQIVIFVDLGVQDTVTGDTCTHVVLSENLARRFS